MLLEILKLIPHSYYRSVKQEIVAEIEGEYGPLTISELLVQKIWARGDFRQTNLTTLEGASLEIVDLGKWNRLAGPDFQGVSIRVNGEIITGDAELHFYDSDWEAHRHETDPAFNKVILHILVFPPKGRVKGERGSIKHSLLFLELLSQGLEAYAEEEALGALSSGAESQLEDELLSLSFLDRSNLLKNAAKKRWLGKVAYAAKRIQALGWEEACHQTALEILGYRYNRAAMLFVAGDYSLSALRSGNHTVATIYEAGLGRWRVSGTRPANHPRQRLFQYVDWVNKRPIWPDNLEFLANKISEAVDPEVLNLSRKDLALNNLRTRLSKAVMADSVGGTRIENLVCDGFLPLMAAQTGKALFPYWFHWFPGDIPAVLKALFRKVMTDSPRTRPLSNGFQQALLQQLLEFSAPIRGK